MTTLSISYSAGRPSEHYPAEERERNGATDYDVTIRIEESVLVSGGITLFRDGVDGTPIDVWCSSSIVALAKGLSRSQRRDLCAALAARDTDLDLDAPFDEGDRISSRPTGSPDDDDTGQILETFLTAEGWRFLVGWDTCGRTHVGADEIRAR